MTAARSTKSTSHTIWHKKSKSDMSNDCPPMIIFYRLRELSVMQARGGKATEDEINELEDSASEVKEESESANV